MNFDQWWQTITPAEQRVIGMHNARFVWEQAAKSTDAVWKEAVIEELVCCHIYNGEHENNPRKAIKDAISWHCQVSLDPQVSSDAQALIDRGREQERSGDWMKEVSSETVSLEVAIEVVLRNGPTFETIAGLCKMAVESDRKQSAQQERNSESCPPCNQDCNQGRDCPSSMPLFDDWPVFMKCGRDKK